MSKEQALKAIEKLQRTQNLLELTTGPKTTGDAIVRSIVKSEDYKIPEADMLALKDYILTAPKQEVFKTIGISPLEEALYQGALHTEEEDVKDSEEEDEDWSSNEQSSANSETESDEQNLGRLGEDNDHNEDNVVNAVDKEGEET